jgi:glucose-6-phosphate isomerase
MQPDQPRHSGYSMPISACKFGATPLTLAWDHLGTSFLAKEMEEAKKEAWVQTHRRFSDQDVGFWDAPEQPLLSELEACSRIALATTRFSQVVCIGIGGSILGPKALLEALGPGQRTFHFLEAPDSLTWQHLRSRLDVRDTCVLAITKSGTTFETLSLLMVVLEWLGPQRWQDQVICLTDPHKGDLRAWAELNKIRTASIHPSIGGRFSVFSPVGLLPLALGGWNTKAFLEGASLTRKAFLELPPEKNPAFVIGARLFKLSNTHPIHGLLTYHKRLSLLGDWFVQLWAESLGKCKKGYFAFSAQGPQFQHSLLQLLKEGKGLEVCSFLDVSARSEGVRIPTLSAMKPFKAFTRLQGHSLEALQRIEFEATLKVLQRAEKPFWRLTLDQIDEKALGSFCFFWSVLTAWMGTLLEVNAFDQPGVEEGKKYIMEALKEDTRQ